MPENEPVILVVDDTEDNLDLLEFALKRKPVRMLRALSGKEDVLETQELVIRHVLSEALKEGKIW